MLVLKTQFNTAWNYFNATELGNTILGSWRSYMDYHSAGSSMTKSMQYPLVSSDFGSIECALDFLSEVQTMDGVKPVPDIRKLDFLHRRVIMSRKHTKNLLDLTSIWKKIVLLQLDKDASNPLDARSLKYDIETPDPKGNDVEIDSLDDSITSGDLVYVRWDALFDVLGYWQL